MKGRTRLISLVTALALLLALSPATPAKADVMTLGVYLRGLLEQEDGTTAQIPLEGSFRVMQGGLDRGVIRAGETTAAVDGTDAVTLLPLPETIPAGWDVTGARTVVSMADGGNVTVPILLPQLKEDTVAETPAPVPETEAPGAAETETGTTASAAETDTPVPEAANEVRTPAPAAQATPTPEWNANANVTAAPTAEPEVGVLNESTDTGTFHIKAF